MSKACGVEGRLAARIYQHCWYRQALEVLLLLVLAALHLGALGGITFLVFTWLVWPLWPPAGVASDVFYRGGMYIMMTTAGVMLSAFLWCCLNVCISAVLRRWLGGTDE
jgi:hypothetical protein